MGIVGVTNLSHGGWEGFETCGRQKHDARMAPKLLKHIEQRDLLLADRAFCSYEFIARVTTEQKGHVLMRLHQARFKKLDWRKGKKVSSFERLVVWCRRRVERGCGVAHCVVRNERSTPSLMPVRRPAETFSRRRRQEFFLER